jgi:hypothetical protein
MKLQMKLNPRATNQQYHMPFGGVTVFISGDLGQLPVVVRWSADMTQVTSMFVNISQCDQFKKIKLDQIQRVDGGAEDAEAFMRLLSEARHGREYAYVARIPIQEDREHDGGSPENQKVRGKKGMVVFYHDCRVDEYNSDIATMKTTKHNKARINMKGCFFVESVEHFQANEERLGDSHRCFTMVPATQGQIDGYFSARRQGEFSTIVPSMLSIFEGARVMLLKNIDPKAGLVNGRRGTV